MEKDTAEVAVALTFSAFRHTIATGCPECSLATDKSYWNSFADTSAKLVGKGETRFKCDKNERNKDFHTMDVAWWKKLLHTSEIQWPSLQKYKNMTLDQNVQPPTHMCRSADIEEDL